MVWLFNLSLFCCLAKINWVESSPFSLYCEMFNRRAGTLKPSLFSRVCLLFFCTPAPPHQYRWLESECSIFVWMCPLKNEICMGNSMICSDIWHKCHEWYSWLLVTWTLYNSKLPLTQSNFYFPLDHFLYNFTLDNLNYFLLPLKIQIIGSRLYFKIVIRNLRQCWKSMRVFMPNVT